MINRLIFFLKFWLFWFAFFYILRIFFIISNLDIYHQFTFVEICKTFYHGTLMDLSAIGYIAILPSFILMVSFFYRSDKLISVIKYYTYILLVFISFLAVSDAELYKFWNFRLDTTPILYIKTPYDALASVSLWVIIRQLLLFLLLSAASIFCFRKYFFDKATLGKVHFAFVLLMALITAALIIPIRGGFGIAPMNVGEAYFSNKQPLNHAAINLFWNVGFSVIETQSNQNKYHFFDESRAKELTKNLYNKDEKADSVYLNNSRPNVVIIILESLSAKIIEPLGGMKNITPHFTELSKQGLLFTNFYANGDRSDKGLVAILSGFPAQPTTSIINYANKSRKLPRLPLVLKKIGYHTSFYYGGDINFANMQSYLLDSQFDHIVTKDSFPAWTYNSKWGANDHVVFRKLLSDLNSAKEPFFAAYFTLSSHEPFEVPSNDIPGNDKVSKMLNAQHYTDSCLFKFISDAKMQPWWNNTLFILVADHGHRDPGESLNHVPEKFKIPMLWLGGVLTRHKWVDKYASQIDITSTLLGQMNINSEKFHYSKNIFGKEHGFAFYAYNNGLGFMTDSCKLVYDCNYNKPLIWEGSKDQLVEDTGKAYLQELIENFSSL